MHNAQYLLTSYTADDLLRQFYERKGKIRAFKPTGSQVFWEEDLAGSNAGRFLMGAGNTVRWIDDAELRKRLNTVVDGIEECRQPNGYIMAYPEDTIFYSERAAYTRAWLTHGLLEAAYAGNPKALPLLRGYYDWFNNQEFLPEMLRGAIQGGQGMIANTRVSLSPVGKPADAQVIQRYYQENAWLDGSGEAGERTDLAVSIRSSALLSTDQHRSLSRHVSRDRREALFRRGAWGVGAVPRPLAAGREAASRSSNSKTIRPTATIFGRSWANCAEAASGSFSASASSCSIPITSSMRRRSRNRSTTSALPTRTASNGFRYHTILEGQKEKATHENTCCEGQGTRLIGSLPEHIYSIAPDGLYRAPLRAVDDSLAAERARTDAFSAHAFSARRSCRGHDQGAGRDPGQASHSRAVVGYGRDGRFR